MFPFPQWICTCMKRVRAVNQSNSRKQVVHMQIVNSVRIITMKKQIQQNFLDMRFLFATTCTGAQLDLGSNLPIQARTGRASVEHCAPFAVVSSVSRLCTKKTPQLLIFNRGRYQFCFDWSIGDVGNMWYLWIMQCGTFDDLSKSISGF